MSDKIHSYSVDSHELKLTMSVPPQQQQQSHHEYGRNLNQDIQLQVIIKENESSLRRTKASKTTSPASAAAAAAASMIKKPVTRAQDLQDNDNTTINGNGQYGKINLNHCRDFRMAQPRNDENPYGYVPEVFHHHPTSFLASEKPETKINCWDSIYFSKITGNLISDKILERTWKYLKWPLLLFLVCAFLGLITYTCMNSRNTRSIKTNCLNFTTNSNCLLMDATEIDNEIKNNSNTILNDEKISDVDTYSQTEIAFEDDEIENEEKKDERVKKEKYEEKDVLEKDVEASEAVLTGSTTLLRPIIVPQLTHTGYREKNHIDKGSKNDYTFIERKSNQKYEELIPSTKIQSPYGQGSTGESKPITRVQIPYGQESGREKETTNNQTEGIKVIGFTSGHQNNFGIPIEEDERILRLLNDELSKLERQTEHSNAVSRTESSLIVSPTVPQIIHEVQEYVTPSSRPFEDIQCQSTSLPMCRGILQYDLTSSNAKSLYLSPTELDVFETLITSNCSTRAIEFVCASLEPECRPTQIGILQPCKRICKSILEACSSLIASSDILTYTFDCDKYPDSYDRNVCEDPTRRSECYDNEFKCEDFSCIPSQWQCDNIKDCSEGEDELGCLVCSPEEFRCRSNEKCLTDEYRCDRNEDCDDGSDEHDCFTEHEENDEDPQLYPRIFSFASFLLPNYTSENSFTAIADEDRLAAGSELNETLASASTSNILHGISTLEEIKKAAGNISRALANFQDSKEIMMTSDSENKMKISHNNSSISSNSTSTSNNMTEVNKNESKIELTTPSSTSCSGNELRCVSGKCITVDQLCDKVMDCPDGEDELMCNYEERPKSKKP
ncbi:uncharacterized protein LOC129918960 [Episyrphus balteatus]|uniref:uncharacterized protein LOC129918960 n=1 Tax=Episyrphus balteatus TaxID=286459 RepID=UPI002486907B|nr:uncharacterized protein LOC129918960 [Episyrphus balteatus]